MASSQSEARTIGLLRPLRDVTVTAGETATFDCELSYEGIVVEWFVGTTKMEPSDRVRFYFIHLFIYFIMVHVVRVGKCFVIADSVLFCYIL